VGRRKAAGTGEEVGDGAVSRSRKRVGKKKERAQAEKKRRRKKGLLRQNMGRAKKGLHVRERNAREKKEAREKRKRSGGRCAIPDLLKEKGR